MDIYASIFIVFLLGIFIISIPRIIKEYKQGKQTNLDDKLIYNKDEQELKLIKNYLIESGLTINKKPDQNIKSLIYNHSAFDHYNWIKIDYSITFGQENYFIMTQVSYNQFFDEGHPEFIENQIVICLSTGDNKTIQKSSKKATLKEAQEMIVRIKNHVS